MSTKYRRKVFNAGTFGYFKLQLLQTLRLMGTVHLIASNHDKDHVHLFLSIPPSISVGSVVRTIKSNTSRPIKEQFQFVRNLYWGSDGIWSDGYFVSTSGVSQEVLTRYIEQQGELDTDQTDQGLFAS